MATTASRHFKIKRACFCNLFAIVFVVLELEVLFWSTQALGFDKAGSLRVACKKVAVDAFAHSPFLSRLLYTREQPNYTYNVDEGVSGT